MAYSLSPSGMAGSSTDRFSSTYRQCVHTSCWGCKVGVILHSDFCNDFTSFCNDLGPMCTNCDPLQQNQEQVLLYINWFSGLLEGPGFYLILKSSLFVPYIWRYDHLWSKPFIFLQKYIVRKWQLKFTFYININGK